MVIILAGKHLHELGWFELFCSEQATCDDSESGNVCINQSFAG